MTIRDIQDNKTCSRCGVKFHCMVENIADCHCNQQVIKEEIVRVLHEKYSDCLCEACLIELTAE